jgi:hypothetical protein
MDSLGSSTGKSFFPVTLVPTIIIASFYMRALFIDAPLLYKYNISLASWSNLQGVVAHTSERMDTRVPFAL